MAPCQLVLGRIHQHQPENRSKCSPGLEARDRPFSLWLFLSVPGSRISCPSRYCTVVREIFTARSEPPPDPSVAVSGTSSKCTVVRRRKMRQLRNRLAHVSLPPIPGYGAPRQCPAAAVPGISAAGGSRNAERSANPSSARCDFAPVRAALQCASRVEENRSVSRRSESFAASSPSARLCDSVRIAPIGQRLCARPRSPYRQRQTENDCDPCPCVDHVASTSCILRELSGPARETPHAKARNSCSTGISRLVFAVRGSYMPPAITANPPENGQSRPDGCERPCPLAGGLRRARKTADHALSLSVPGYWSPPSTFSIAVMVPNNPCCSPSSPAAKNRALRGPEVPFRLRTRYPRGR